MVNPDWDYWVETLNPEEDCMSPAEMVAWEMLATASEPIREVTDEEEAFLKELLG